MDRIVDNYFNLQVLARASRTSWLVSASRFWSRCWSSSSASAWASGSRWCAHSGPPRRPAHRHLHRRVPHAAAARRDRLHLFRLALCGALALAFRDHGAGARRDALGLLGGDLLVRDHGGAARAKRCGQGARALAPGTLALVILPQAIRLALPILTNRAIAISKGTALGTAVALPETLGRRRASWRSSPTRRRSTLAALFYLALFMPLVAGAAG